MNKYIDKFNELLKAKTTVSNHKGTEQITLSDNLSWQQCYKANDPLRCNFPLHWFVSEKGDVLSLKGTPCLLNKNIKQKSGYVYYRYDIKTPNGHKSKHIKAHILVSLCFDVLKYGKAQEIIDLQGVHAYEKRFIHTHHQHSDTTDNSAKNIEVLSSDAHIAISKKRMNTQNAMIQLGRMAANEEPDKITVLQTDEMISGENKKTHTRALLSVDKVEIKKEALLQLCKISEDVGEILLLQGIISNLNNDFFIKPKYYINIQKNICFMIVQNKNKVTISRIEDINTVSGLQLIPYDNNGTCYIDNKTESEVI